MKVKLFVTPWTVAYQAPPSMGFSRQECWSGFPFPSPGDLPNPGIEPGSPALRADALSSETPGKPLDWKKRIKVYEDQDSSPGWWHSPRHQTPLPLYVSITNLRSHNSKAEEGKKSVQQHQWANTLHNHFKDYQLNSSHNRGISLYLLLEFIKTEWKSL